MKTTLIVSPDIQLRLPNAVQPALFLEIIQSQRAYLRQWLPWVDKTQTLEETDKYLKNANIFTIGGQRLTTFIYYQNRLAGSVALVRIDKNNQVGEIGYWLDQGLQGKGIVTQSCQTLISYVFRNMAINRLELRVTTTNPSSLSIPPRLQFQYEGTLSNALRIHGEFHDLKVFALLKAEWIDQQKQKNP